MDARQFECLQAGHLQPLIMVAVKEKFNYLAKRPVLIFGMGCLLLFIISFFGVYWLRVIYSPAWLGQIKGSLVVFFTLFVVFGIIRFGARFKDKNPRLFLSLCLFVLGVLFAFATPPNQVPDENTHFLRAYSMAEGQWGFDANHIYPNDVRLLMKYFPTAYNNGHPAKQGDTVYDRFTDYKAAVSSGEERGNLSIIIFQVIPYIPGAIGIFLARLLGFGALGAYYGCRLANRLFFCICAYWAFKTADRFKMIMFTLAAMPLIVFLCGSCSSDAVLFGLMFVMFASVLAEKFDNKMLFAFRVSYGILTVHKMSYCVFLLLLLGVKKENFDIEVNRKKHGRLLRGAVCLVFFVLLYQGMGLYVKMFSNYGVIERTMENSDPAAQLIFILKNPLRYRAVAFDTLLNNSFFLFSGGLLGYLDVKLSLVNYLTPVAVILCCVKQRNIFTREDERKTLRFLICSLLTYAVVVTGLYLSWTPVTLPQVIGLQMRYFYPAFMGFCMVLGQYFGKRTKPDVKNTDMSCVVTSCVFCVVAAALMLITYYLPRPARVFVA